jgi:hypothetical protein
LRPHVFKEALYVIPAEIEREGIDSKIPEAEIERVAATRGIALIDAGKRKQRDTWVHIPPSWIREVLEMFARGVCLSQLGRNSGARGPGFERRPPHYECLALDVSA